MLDEVTNLQYKEYLLKIPVEGNTIVGGNVTLKANQLSIACMHGEMTSNMWETSKLLNYLLFKSY